jgi:hypothetical protein
MGNGLSVVAIPQWYREWTLKYGKRGFIAASQAATWDRSAAAGQTSDAAAASRRARVSAPAACV